MLLLEVYEPGVNTDVMAATSLQMAQKPVSAPTDWIATDHFEALGTGATIAVTVPERLKAASAAVLDTVAAFDQACSRFRPDSELEALNAASGEPFVVGALLLDAIDAALRAAEVTEGDVDPTVGAVMLALGYDRDFKEVVEERRSGASARLPPVEVPGWRTLRMDRAAGTVRAPKGLRLDLGATAKALAADRAAVAAARAAGCAVLVSLGGDIATAGSPAKGWRVRVTDDHHDGEAAPGQWIALSSGGLATSSTTARRWHMPWGPVHHLVDPATGTSTTGPWRTVTVAAASCLDANTASTAAIVKGSKAEDWLRGLGLPSRLVACDGRAHHLAGWPTDGDDLA
jgi:thiamine biosynthesis lipoprotein